jgi:dolichol-phosphate mannosyltransferase
MNNCVFLIPVYNEEGSIQDVIESISVLQKHNVNIKKIIVIDDGSTDRTPAILKEMQKKNSRIHILTHFSNEGVEEVFRNGIKEAMKFAEENDIIIILEGDNTNDPHAIPKMIDEVANGADLVVASRFIRGGAFVGFPFSRRMISRLGNILLRLAFRIDNVTDYTIFLRAYKGKILKDALKTYKDNLFETKGFVVNTELLVKAAKFANKISEVPHFYNYTRKVNYSKFKVFKTARDQLLYIFKNLFYG